MMRLFGILGFFFLVSTVHTQSVADLPSCSLECFATAVTASHCGTTDYKCQCTTGKSIITNSVTPCLLKSTCTATDLQKVQSFSETFCPALLASASASSQTSRTIASSSSQITSTPKVTNPTSPTESSVVLSASTSSAALAVESFGAGVKGTAWGKVKGNEGNGNRGPGIEAASIALFCVACLVVAFRFYARFKTKQLRQVTRSLGADEWFALAALMFTGGVVGTVIAGVKFSMGKHLAKQTGPELVHLVQVVYSFVLIVTEALGALKLSILCLYLRMTPEKSHKITIYIMMGIVVAHNIAAFFAAMFQCWPISDYWDLSKEILANQSCVNILVLDMFNNCWSVLEDIIIWFLPIPVVYKLKVPASRKSGLYALIGISFISVLAAILRLNSMVIWIRSPDISWNYPLIPFFSTLECCIALITSSTPAIYPLFRRSTTEIAQKRRSQMLEDQMAQQKHDDNKTWESGDTTLTSGAGTERSRWSWFSWHGPANTRVRDKEAEMDVFGKELQRVNEEEVKEEKDDLPGRAV